VPSRFVKILTSAPARNLPWRDVSYNAEAENAKIPRPSTALRARNDRVRRGGAYDEVLSGKAGIFDRASSPDALRMTACCYLLRRLVLRNRET